MDIAIIDPEKLNLKAVDLEIIILIAEGDNDTEIGEKLDLTKHAIKSRVTNLRLRFNARNRAQLISEAYHLGILIGKK